MHIEVNIVLGGESLSVEIKDPVPIDSSVWGKSIACQEAAAGGVVQFTVSVDNFDQSESEAAERSQQREL